MQNQLIWTLDRLIGEARLINGRWEPGFGLGVSTRYGPEYDFVYSYESRFPGKWVVGPKCMALATRRLRRLCNTLVTLGLADRDTCMREKTGSNAVWMYVYRTSLHTLFMAKIRHITFSTKKIVRQRLEEA